VQIEIGQGTKIWAGSNCIVYIDTGMCTYSFQAETKAGQDEWVSDLVAHGILADENSAFGMAELIMSEEGRMRCERWMSNVNSILGSDKRDRSRGGGGSRGRAECSQDHGCVSSLPVAAALYAAHADSHAGILAKANANANHKYIYASSSARPNSTAEHLALGTKQVRRKQSTGRNLRKTTSGQGLLYTQARLAVDIDGNISRGPSRSGSPRRSANNVSPRARVPLPLQRVPSGYSYWDMQQTSVAAAGDTIASETRHSGSDAETCVNIACTSISDDNGNDTNNEAKKSNMSEKESAGQQRELRVDTALTRSTESTLQECSQEVAGSGGSISSGTGTGKGKDQRNLKLNHSPSPDDEITIRSTQVQGPSPRISTYGGRVRAVSAAAALRGQFRTSELLLSLDCEENSYHYGPVNTTWGETATLTPRGLAYYSAQTFGADSDFSDSDEDSFIGGADNDGDDFTDTGTENAEDGMYEFDEQVGFHQNSSDNNARRLMRNGSGVSGRSSGGNGGGDGLNDWDTMDDLLYPAGKSPLFSGLSSNGSIADSGARLRKGHECRSNKGTSCKYVHSVLQQLRISQTLYKALRWANDTHRYREKMRHDLNVTSREQWIEAMWIFDHFLAPDLMASSSSGLDIYEASAKALAVRTSGNSLLAKAVPGAAATTTAAGVTTSSATTVISSAGTEDPASTPQNQEVSWVASLGAMIRCRDRILQNIEICAGYASYHSPAVMQREREREAALSSSTEGVSDQGDGASKENTTRTGTPDGFTNTKSQAIMMKRAVAPAVAGMKIGSPSGSTSSPSPSPQQTGGIWGWFTARQEVSQLRQAPDLSDGREEYITLDFDAKSYRHEAHSDLLTNANESPMDLASPRSQVSHGSSASGFYAEERGHRRRAFQVFSITNPVEPPPANLFDEISAEVEAYYIAQAGSVSDLASKRVSSYDTNGEVGIVNYKTVK